MSILCALFGHRQVKDFQWGRRPVTGAYVVDIHGPLVDGVGRNHFSLFVLCPRCEERYLACKVHGELIAERIESAQRVAP